MAVIVHAVVASASSPFGEFALTARSAVRISSRPTPIWLRRLGSTRTRTAGLAPPPTMTWPTPETCESFWARIESAASNRRLTWSVCEVRPRIRIGASAGFTLR